MTVLVLPALGAALAQAVVALLNAAPDGATLVLFDGTPGTEPQAGPVAVVELGAALPVGATAVAHALADPLTLRAGVVTWALLRGADDLLRLSVGAVDEQATAHPVVLATRSLAAGATVEIQGPVTVRYA